MAGETRARRGFGFHIESITGLQWFALLLAAVTGAIHHYRYTSEDWLPFLLAGLGFFGAIALSVFDVYRYYLYPIGTLYTVAQIVGYLLFPMGEFWLDVADTVVQVSLILVLGYHFLRERGSRR